MINTLAFILILAGPAPASPAPSKSEPAMLHVVAAAETDPVPSLDDAADDPAIWVHPSDPAKSLILGTDKKHGLMVYSMAGKQVQALPQGRLNNVDLRYGFGGVDVAAATNRTNRTIDFFTISADGVVTVAGSVDAQMPEPYGVCLYRSAKSGEMYVIACDKSGHVRQWRMSAPVNGVISASPVREFHVGTQSEGMVCDDARGVLFIGEEKVGIWKYGAEPDAENTRELVDVVRPLGSLVADVEGLCIYHAPGGGGYLIASAQGENSFRVYDLAAPHALRSSFTVSAGAALGAVEETDGLDVTSAPLGPAFPNGAVVVQDGHNEGRPQNFKVVRWEDIAKGSEPPLVVAPVSPR